MAFDLIYLYLYFHIFCYFIRFFLGQRPTSPIQDPRVTHLLDKIANAYVIPPII